LKKLVGNFLTKLINVPLKWTAGQFRTGIRSMLI